MIATSLIDVLLEKNFEILAIVRPNSKRKNNISKNDKVTIIECDLSNLLELTKKVRCEYDVFFHFGWSGTIGDGRNNSYLQLNNVYYTLNAVKLAKFLGCQMFIGAGSQAEYGVTEKLLSPNLNVNPQSGYGVAKYAAGKLSRLLAENLGIEHIWTRILSVYGPNDNSNTMIMSAINKLLNGEKPSFTKSEQLWDYLYCEDAAKAFYLISQKGGGKSNVYCLGSGKAIPLKEYIIQLRDCINPNLPLGIGDLDYAPNQVMHLCADISQLSKDTGFKPTISFEGGIKKTIDWVNNSKNY